jgi:hypothetical protein
MEASLTIGVLLLVAGSAAAGFAGGIATTAKAERARRLYRAWRAR